MIDAKSTTEHDGSSLQIGKEVTLTVTIYFLLLYYPGYLLKTLTTSVKH